MQKSCSKCGASFDCGANSPDQNCWCNELPKITPTDNSDCLCPTCLAEKTGTSKLPEIGSAETKWN